MKAIVINKPFQLEIEDVPMPKIASENEVLVKITSGGICGSDIGIYNGTNSLATYPRIIGHEFAGVVEEIGSSVTRVKPGDKVCIDPVVSCGKCYACRIGRHNVCETLEVIGVHRDGGFREYICVPQNNVYKVDTTIVPESLLCLVEPFSIGVQANTRGEVKAGDKVVVFGSGPIGLCTLQVAKQRGAEVLITDILDERLSRAAINGADVTVNAKNYSVKEAVKHFTNGEGAHVVIDSVCSTQSFVEALEIAAPAGRVVVLGLTNKPSDVAQVLITKKELTVAGSRLNKYRFDEVIKGFETKTLHPEKIRTHSFDYTQVGKAFDLIINHPEEVCKVTLSFE